MAPSYWGARLFLVSAPMLTAFSDVIQLSRHFLGLHTVHVVGTNCEPSRSHPPGKRPRMLMGSESSETQGSEEQEKCAVRDGDGGRVQHSGGVQVEPYE